VDREKRKDLLDGIGTLAIVGSLIFVGVETRDSSRQTELNTRAVEIAAYQQLMSNIATVNAQSITSEDAAGMLAAMRERPESEVRSQRIEGAFFQYFRHGDTAFFMYERGVIDEARLQSSLRPLPLYTETGHLFWEENKVNFVPAHQEHIDALIDDGFWVN